MSRKVILYIAMSVDGYIAKPNDDLSFLSIVEKDGEDYGYAEFVNSVDTIIMGRKTYEWVTHHHVYPHQDKTSYIITKSQKENVNEIHFYNGDLSELIQMLKSQEGKNIYCDGGAQIANELFRLDLIDEMILSVIPIFLGDGIKLFQDNRPEKRLKLIDQKAFESGLVQLHYQRVNS